MRKDANGQLFGRKTKKGTVWALRFGLGTRDAEGKPERAQETIGKSWEGCDRREAEIRAERLLAQVKLGQYRTREQRTAEAAAKAAGVVVLPTFEEFADEWLEKRRVLGGKRGRGLSESAESDLTWRLGHLYGWFGDMRLDEITERDVDNYSEAKRGAQVRKGRLGSTSTNKTLATLEAILKVAVRYRLIDRDPVDGTRVPGSAKKTAYLSSAAQIVALLDAAADLDRGRRGREGHGRPLLAVLVYGGLRISEALDLHWRDINLANGTIRVRGTKTENAERTVYIVAPLRDELDALMVRRAVAPSSRVFGTATGNRDSPSNVRTRLVAPALKAANIALEKAKEDAGPDHLTPHGLRHTFASVLLNIGEDPRYVMGQLGHSDPTFTLRVYGKEMKRRDGERERLKALVLGETIPAANDATAQGNSAGAISSSAR